MDGERSVLEHMREISRDYGNDYVKRKLIRGWEQPGKMFDELGEVFRKNNKLFLIGEEDDIERLMHKLRFIGVPAEHRAISEKDVLDGNGIEKISFQMEGYTVILGFDSIDICKQLIDKMTATGKFFHNVNVFIEEDFVSIRDDKGDYCSIFAVYTTGKVYLKHQNILATTVCNLNCEYCLNYNPYNRQQRHFSLDELKNSVDIYFSHIDRVGFFELTGGEPMLSPVLKDIVVYIGEHYREKIDMFTIVTNGTVIPDEVLLLAVKKYGLTIIVDDYTAAMPQSEDKLNELIKKLKEYEVQMIVNPKIREFLKTFPPQKKNMEMSEDGLKEKYCRCTLLFQNLRDGRLCSCTYQAFAVNAGLIEDDDSNWFDMSQMTGDIEDKKKLVEFRCGFNPKGYVDWCRYCNGLQKINQSKAPAAEQAKGRLEWDIASPVFLAED